MTAIISDIVEGTLRRDENGFSATRVFFVDRVLGSALEKQYQVYQLSGIPKYGEPHPVVPGIKVQSVDVSQHEGDSEQCRVDVSYGGDSTGSQPTLEGTGIKGIEVNTSTVTIRTNLDYRGERMIYKYVGPEFILQLRSTGSIFDFSDPSTASTVTRMTNIALAGEAEVDVPAVVVTVTVERNKPSHIDAWQKTSLTNRYPWSGLPAKTWLCIGIDSSQNSTGAYDWRYVFAIAPKDPNNSTWLFKSEALLNVGFVRGDIQRAKGPLVKTKQGTSAQQLILNNTDLNGIGYFDVYEPVNFQSIYGFSIPTG